METNTPGQTRNAWLDRARGLAVLAMIVYHFSWDLSHFGVIETDVALDAGWRRFAHVIAAGFLGIAGISLALATHREVASGHLLRRLGVVAGAAGLVTVASYVAFPDSFIAFGILHCIAFAGLCGLGLRRLPWPVVAALGIGMLALPGFLRLEAFNHPALVWLGLGTAAPRSNDFVPVLPWMGYFLVGLAGGLGPGRRLPATEGGGWLTWLGRWSLVIYLVHQPVLFGAVALAGRSGLVEAEPALRGFVTSCTSDCVIGGAAPGACTRACACVARTLRDRPIWPRLIADRLAAEDSDELSMVGQRCYGAATGAAGAETRP